MKKLLALLFVLVSMIALASCGGNGTLVVYTEAGFAPFEYVSNGAITGVDVEIMNLVGEKLGKKVADGVEKAGKTIQNAAKNIKEVPKKFVKKAKKVSKSRKKFYREFNKRLKEMEDEK